jgi:hypothetical protein
MLDSLVSEEASDSIAEASPWLVSAHPGAVAGSRPALIWWNFINQPGSTATYWHQAEQAALAESGILLDKPGLAQAREVFAWQNAFLKAQEKVLLVRPEKLRGATTEPHPFWDMITAFAEKIEGKEGVAKNFIRDVTRSFFTAEGWRLSGREGRTTAVTALGLPQGQNEYSIPGQMVNAPKSTSYSDMSTLIACPLKWVLEKAAKIRASDSSSIPDLHRSIGTLCHHIAQDIFTPSAPHLKPENARQAAERLFDEKIEALAIELCAEGREVERARCRRDVGKAVHDLCALINNRQLKVERAEIELERNICGVSFKGILDLLLRDKQGAPVVMDLKWEKSDQYRRKEIEEGRALQLASYTWLLEGKETGADIKAGYFILPRNSWLPDGRDNLRLVFSNAEKTWREALKTLGQGKVMAKGRTAEAQDVSAQDISADAADLPDAALELKAPCHFCSYDNLCGINDINDEPTADATAKDRA